MIHTNPDGSELAITASALIIILSYALCIMALLAFLRNFDADKKKEIYHSMKMHVQATPNHRTVSMEEDVNSSELVLPTTVRRYSQTRDYPQSRSCSYSRSHTHSVSTSHSELLEIFEEEYKQDMRAKYNVHTDFVEDCKTIFDALSQIFIPPVYAHIIAGYAATQYVYCMECQDVFGCIECRADYVIAHGARAVENEHGQIRYYLDIEPADVSQCDATNNYKQETEILCIQCAQDKKCGICEGLVLSYNEIVDACVHCKVIICELCMNKCMFKDAKGNTFCFCEKCDADGDVDSTMIANLMRERTASFDYLNGTANDVEKSKSSSNDWKKWEFDFADDRTINFE